MLWALVQLLKKLPNGDDCQIADPRLVPQGQQVRVARDQKVSIAAKRRGENDLVFRVSHRHWYRDDWLDNYRSRIDKDQKLGDIDWREAESRGEFLSAHNLSKLLAKLS